MFENQNEISEFHKLRKPFYIDPQTGLVKFPTTKYMDKSHSEWFTEMGLPWSNIVRGYYLEDVEEPNIVIYANSYNIPDTYIGLIVYLFEHFPKIKWIGLGCFRGEPNTFWEPQLKVYRNY